MLIIYMMVVIFMNHKENDIVLPGETLCTYEEYIPAEWTYIDDGIIKSAIHGIIKIDEINKTIAVQAPNTPRRIKLGDIVVGHITEVKPHKALVTIKKIVDSNRGIVAGYKGYIHISRVTNDYVSSMHDLFKIGDIIEAKVINILGSEYVELTTAEIELGVIKAMCINCRKFMKLTEGNKLSCECGVIDTRKISSRYGGY